MLKNGETYVESYFDNGGSPLLWPGVMDTTDLDLWSAYEAAKDDMILIDQLGGATPLIVESWMGPDQLHPSQEDDKQTLMDTLDGYLVLP
ncbi:MAG: hypothetical protein ACPGU1_17520 [Myxococcota bacterium]